MGNELNDILAERYLVRFAFSVQVRRLLLWSRNIICIFVSLQNIKTMHTILIIEDEPRVASLLTPFVASIQALPLSYFPWLVGILLSYCVLTQLVKNWYIRKFSGWL